MVVRTKRSDQGLLPFGNGWGGARKDAGRKANGERPGVSHRQRERLASRFPVHVTVRLRQGLPCLRRKKEYGVLRAAFVAGCGRLGLRLAEYSVQRDHLHLLVEAKDRGALARRMQGLPVRVARPVAAARTWLLRVGWRARGLLGFTEVPGPPPSPAAARLRCGR